MTDLANLRFESQIFWFRDKRVTARVVNKKNESFFGKKCLFLFF